MEENLKTMTVKIEGDASQLKEELAEVRKLAKKTGSALAGAKAKVRSIDKRLEREMPENEDVLLSLRRFVVRVAEDERATPDQLRAMSEVAAVIVCL